jgi:TonB-dependent starch-binding outer membrane protein SusC
MLSAYDHAVLLNETYKINNIASESFFSESDLNQLKNLNYKSWFDELWEPAITQRHSLNLSGGSENITFFIGGGYQNQNANYAGQKADKFTMRSGLTAKLTKSLSAEVMANVDHNIRFSKNGWSENDQPFLEKLIQVPRWTPVKIGDKYVNYDNSNPLALINSGFYNDRKTRGYGINASLVFAPATGFFQVSQTVNNTRS